MIRTAYKVHINVTSGENYTYKRFVREGEG